MAGNRGSVIQNKFVLDLQLIVYYYILSHRLYIYAKAEIHLARGIQKKDARHSMQDIYE